MGLTHEQTRTCTHRCDGGSQRNAPVIVATTAKAQSWTGADIVTALTIVYLVLQILWLLWKWWKSVKSGAVQG